MPATIRVGTASWTDHEPFYPPEYAKSSMQSRRIEYYARYFSMVEVDSTFYRLQPAHNFELWAERTPPDFVFDVKAYGELTWHHRQDDGTLVTPGADTFARFDEMLQPMRAAHKLGAILFQFPPWFTFDHDRLDYFATVREMLPQDTLAVEFRHRSWLEGEHGEATRAALSEQRLAYCAVDEPQVGSGSVPPVVLVTDPRFAMVRFHGRNAKTWYGRNLKSSRDRFDYLYSTEELKPWAERIERIAERLEADGAIHVVTNNNARNYGVVNALDLQGLLGQSRGQGQELPPGVQATIREREAAGDAGAGAEKAERPAP
jgi:uncharacterized protein YecE (DUF72 family)